MDMSTFVPATAPSAFYPPQFGYQYGMPPYMYPAPSQAQFPIIKNYSINVGGANGDHTKLSMIYEDVLPTKNIGKTITTIDERLSIHNFIRSVMFSKSDGQDINLNGEDSNSILSHLKFMDLNPYNTYKFSNNPYKGLPNGMLLYRSCYPIRHDAVEGSVTCAKNSIGMNIRIYKLLTEEYMAGKILNNNGPVANTVKNRMDYNVWREVAYYEYVREYIIKKKECPNFATMHGFYISEKSMIDFDKVNTIRGQELTDVPKYIKDTTTQSNIPRGSNVQQQKDIKLGVPRRVPEMRQTGGGENPIEIVRNRPAPPTTTVKSFLFNIPCPDDNKNENKPQIQGYASNGVSYTINPESYTGKALVILSESPFYNIFAWASKTYQVEGNIKRMINTGVHSESVWHSILFQLIASLYCMQIHGIVFNNFSIEDNVYIKDLSVHGNVTTYWKYKIDGIDYYIPNYGYLLMIDSSYKDLPLSQTSILPNKASSEKFKVVGKPFNDQMNETDIKKATFNNFKKVMNSNVYNQTFINEGGCEPPTEIKRLLDNITDNISRDTENNIGSYIYKFMGRFINNRVGTYLKELEVPNIRRDDIKDYKKGQILVWEEASNTYRFVMYIKEKSSGVSLILTRDNSSKEIIENEVSLSSLYCYSKVEPIAQNFKPNESNMNEDDLLETYIIMSS
jgi:hypothetical protein